MQRKAKLGIQYATSFFVENLILKNLNVPQGQQGFVSIWGTLWRVHVLYVSELLNVHLMHFDWTTYRLFESWIMYKLIAWLHLHGSIMIFMSEKLDFKMWYVWSLISYLSRLICSLQHLTCQSWMAFILFIHFF